MLRSHPSRIVFRKRTFVIPLFCAASLASAQTVAEKPESSAIQLSPFLVSESETQGYYASSSLAGTRLKSDLRDLASSVQVVTREFMDDVGAVSANTLLQYTTSTETAGIQGNFAGTISRTADQMTTGDARQNSESSNRVRGLGSPDQTRGYFKTDIPFDGYNTQRVDINRGANSFLFGLGSPAGLINTSLTLAEFKNSHEVSTRVGTGGDRPSYRGSFNFNRELIAKVLALRVAGLVDRTQYRQEPTYRDDDRGYAAVTYRPLRNTTLRAHFEKGKISGNPPEVLLPQENLSTFFNEPIVGRMAVDVVANMRATNNIEGAFNNRPTANSLTNIPGGNHYALIWDGSDPNGLPSYARVNGIRSLDINNGDPYWDPTNNGKNNVSYVQHGNLQQIMGAGWSQQGFTNLDTFDFTRHNLGGNNDYNRRKFDNANVALEQLLWDGRGGFELAFDQQNYATDTFAAFHAGSERIAFDINPVLLHPTTEGSLEPAPNPNFGRPMIGTQTWRTVTDSEREALRLTAFFSHDFRRGSKGWLGRLLGSHRATVLGDRSTYERKVVMYKMASFGDPDPGTALQGDQSLIFPEVFGRSAWRMIYIGPPQLEAFTDPNFTLADVKIAPTTANLNLPDGFSLPIFYWDRGTTATRDEAWKRGIFEPRWAPSNTQSLLHSKVTSFAFNTQSKILDELLVVNLGWRTDRVATNERISDAPRGPNGMRLVDDANWNLNGRTPTIIEESVLGYGFVANWPKKLVRLPSRMDLAFHYNDTQNFVPETGLSDILGRALPPPTGTSKEYGVTVFLADNKFVGRFNWFEGSLANTLGGNYWQMVNGTGNNFMQTYGRLRQGTIEVDRDGDGQIDPGVQNPERYINFQRALAARALLGPMLSPEFRQRFNYAENADGSFTSASNNQNVTDVADVTTKGLEIELVVNPSRNWRLAFNAAKYETSLTNIAPRLAGFVDDVVLPYLTQFGDLDFDQPLEPVQGATTLTQLNTQLLQLFAAQAAAGSPQAEQPKWRANFVTNYRFTEGRLRGFSFGGAARWQGKFAIGYPLLDRGGGLVVQDIAKPYWSEEVLGLDLRAGYRCTVFRNIDWTIQLNIQNVNNWNSRNLTTLRAQPNGAAARVRFDPPREIFVTNTFRF